MKVITFKKWITVLLVLSLVPVLLPLSPAAAAGIAVVSVSAPANIPTGGTFVARINISQVPAFVSYQIQLNYDKNVIQVSGLEGGPDGVTAGLIGTNSLPVDMWSFSPAGAPVGSIRILGRGPGNQSLSGSGYLAEIHFNVVGSIGQQTGITPTETSLFQNGLFDSLGNKLATAQPWAASTVQVYLPLQISTSALPEGAMGSSYSSVNLVAAGGAPLYTWNADNLPQGLSISGSGTISGTPTVSGNYSVVLHVNDVAGGSVDKTLNLLIYPLLQISTTALPDATKGVGYNLNLSVSGGKPGYSWSSLTLPAGLSISNSGSISGSPSVAGDFSNVAITVADSFNPTHTTTKTFLMHINGGFDITTSSLPDAAVGSFYSTTASVTGGTSPYNWSAAGLPGGLSIDPLTGTISGTPTATFNSNISLTVTDASNPQNSTTKQVALQVYPALAITTNALPRSGVEIGNSLPQYPGWVIGVPYPANPFTLSATGGKPGYSWTASGLPTGLTLSSVGAISGTPGVSGLFTINLTVTDSANPPKSASKQLYLKIYKQGDASGDNDVNIVDVTFVERVILGLNAPTAGGDANLNGSISIGDVTKIERIILGLP